MSQDGHNPPGLQVGSQNPINHGERILALEEEVNGLVGHITITAGGNTETLSAVTIQDSATVTWTLVGPNLTANAVGGSGSGSYASMAKYGGF